MEHCTLPPDAIPTLEALTSDLKLGRHDLLLIGDGSGTIYNEPAGWGCVALDCRKQKVTLHTGTISTATNNFAELFPYIQALWHHHQEHQQAPATPVKVQIISDSQLTVRCGNKMYTRRANGCLWSSIEWFEQNGYQLAWFHVPRNSNPWNTLMDSIAGKARRLMLTNLPGLLKDSHQQSEQANSTKSTHSHSDSRRNPQCTTTIP